MGAHVAELLSDNAWTATASVALAAVFAASILNFVGRKLVQRAFGGNPVARAFFLQIERPAAAVLPLLALEVVWGSAPDNLRFIGTVQHVNVVLLIAALTWLAIGAIHGVADALVTKHPATIEDNLAARRLQTQANVLARSASVLAIIAGASMALMTFPGARHLGASLLASAGVVGLVGGMAARPVFSNLIAGLQLAIAQPIRIDDVLVVSNEWGRVEEITGTYVVLKLWDERRLVVPLNWFIENPFQNWTRSSSQIHQAVHLFVDFATPLEPLRQELQRLVQQAPEWDGRTATLVVMDTTENRMKLRVLVSARAAGAAYDLGCRMREGLIAFLAREYPGALPSALRPAKPI